MHEVLVTEEEAKRTMYFPWTLVICPFQHDWDGDWDIGGSPLIWDKYASNTAKRPYKHQELVQMIKNSTNVS